MDKLFQFIMLVTCSLFYWEAPLAESIYSDGYWKFCVWGAINTIILMTGTGIKRANVSSNTLLVSWLYFITSHWALSATIVHMYAHIDIAW